jgi:DNA mismatch repair protein MutS
MNASPSSTIQTYDPTGATPVMQQFFEMKARQPDALIFFRMGDFYELFFDDAYKAAAALGISQTFRGNHNGQPIPMAGVPQHAAEAYLSKLIRMGFKVAVCEQMEDPAEAKKRGSKSVVRRDIVRVVTPGTLTEDGLLDARGANRLAAVAMRAGQAAVASVELSTGEVEVFAVAKEGVAAILAALAPSETLVADRLLSDDSLSQTLKICGGLVQPMPSALSEPQASEARVKRLYGVETLDGFGGLSPAEIGALGLIAAHLEMTQAGKLPALRAPRRAAEADVMAIDPATRGSLEIDRTQSGDRNGSLLAVIDRTVTSGGARMLASRLARPLLDVAAIDQRLDAVEWFVEHRQLRQRLREVLKGAGDMARGLSRLALGRGGPRDLGCLRDTLKVGERLAGMAGGAPDPLSPPPYELEHAFKALTPSLHEGLSQFLNMLEQGLGPDLPALARDGGFVAPGIRPELDQARGLRDDSRKVIAALESQLALESGVPFKIRHNNVLGYFVEVTAQHGDKLMQPPLNATFIHRQTLAGQVRFTTVRTRRDRSQDRQCRRPRARAGAGNFRTAARWRRGVADDLPRRGHAFALLDVATALAKLRSMTTTSAPEVDNSLRLRHRGRPAPRRRTGAEARRPAVHRQCQRPLAGAGAEVRPDLADHRPEHGRQVDLPAPERADRHPGADRLLRAGDIRPYRRRRPAVLARRRLGRSGARPLDLHGRDGRDRGDPQPGRRTCAGDPRRDRPRHRHLRRPVDRLGRVEHLHEKPTAAAASSPRTSTS